MTGRRSYDVCPVRPVRSVQEHRTGPPYRDISVRYGTRVFPLQGEPVPYRTRVPVLMPWYARPQPPLRTVPDPGQATMHLTNARIDPDAIRRTVDLGALIS